jgi:H/ACA ribonucleoprotein complex non-core subunit NAF1
VIGFIYEPIGPVTMPLYSIQLYPNFVDKITSQTGFTNMREALHGKECFVVKRCLKLINSRLDSILKQKGCDASNMFDEELGQDEQEFSDDDQEKEFKRLKKQKKRGDFEEGELPDQIVGKKRGNYASTQEF